jgi:hypothetical protein
MRKAHDPVNINGINCLHFHEPLMVCMSAIKTSILDEGFRQTCPIYGGVEQGMWGKLKQKNLWQVVLKDYHEDYRLQAEADEKYLKWKSAHVSGRFPGGFEEFIKCNS